MEVTHAFAEQVRWPDPKRGPWRVSCEWANVDGYARLIGVNIRGFAGDNGPAPGEPVETLTATVFRSLPLIELADQAFAQIKKRQGLFQVGPEVGDSVDITGSHTPGGKTGRQPLTIDELERVAAIYRGGGTKPTKTVAEALCISVSAAAKRVKRARDAGLLDKTTQGRVGGPTVRTRATKRTTKRGSK
jgi:hypothetical protein